MLNKFMNCFYIIIILTIILLYLHNSKLYTNAIDVLWKEELQGIRQMRGFNNNKGCQLDLICHQTGTS